jgi:hypothetical protein
VKPDTPVGIGCRIIGEFDDDASGFAEAEPEFVSSQATSGPLLAAPAGTPTPAAVPPPSAEALAAAKKFWVKVIRRFTEPVPAKKGRLRVRDSGDPNRGSIEVRCATYRLVVGNDRARHELDVSDKQCLTLFQSETPAREKGEQPWVKELSVPIPWTEIANIQFVVWRSTQGGRRAGKSA